MTDDFNDKLNQLFEDYRKEQERKAAKDARAEIAKKAQRAAFRKQIDEIIGPDLETVGANLIKIGDMVIVQDRSEDDPPTVTLDVSTRNSRITVTPSAIEMVVNREP